MRTKNIYRDYRKGNFIIDKEQGEYDGLTIICYWGNLDDDEFCQLIKPVILTEKILRILNFRKSKSGVFYRRVNKSRIEYSQEGKALTIAGRKSKLTLNNIKYLHEMQNCIWIGTGYDWDYCEMRDLIWYNR